MPEKLEYWKLLPDPLKHLGAFSASVAKDFPDPKFLNLILLRVSQLNGCAYCVDMHVRDALTSGETSQRVNVVAAWPESDALFTPAERAALAWAESLTYLPSSKPADLTAREHAYAAVRSHYSDLQVAQLGYAIASINAWNRIAVGFNRSPAPRT